MISSEPFGRRASAGRRSRAQRARTSRGLRPAPGRSWRRGRATPRARAPRGPAAARRAPRASCQPRRPVRSPRRRGKWRRSARGRRGVVGGELRVFAGARQVRRVGPAGAREGLQRPRPVEGAIAVTVEQHQGRARARRKVAGGHTPDVNGVLLDGRAHPAPPDAPAGPPPGGLLPPGARVDGAGRRRCSGLSATARDAAMGQESLSRSLSFSTTSRFSSSSAGPSEACRREEASPFSSLGISSPALASVSFRLRYSTSLQRFMPMPWSLFEFMLQSILYAHGRRSTNIPRKKTRTIATRSLRVG